MNADERTYPSGDLWDIWDGPGKNGKANLTMKAEKGTYYRKTFKISEIAQKRPRRQVSV